MTLINNTYFNNKTGLINSIAFISLVSIYNIIMRNYIYEKFVPSYEKDNSKFIVEILNLVCEARLPVYPRTFIYVNRARGSALIAVAKFQPNYHFGQPPSGSEFLSADAQQKTEVTSAVKGGPKASVQREF